MTKTSIIFIWITTGNSGDRHGQNFYDGQERWNIYWASLYWGWQWWRRWWWKWSLKWYLALILTLQHRCPTSGLWGGRLTKREELPKAAAAEFCIFCIPKYSETFWRILFSDDLSVTDCQCCILLHLWNPQCFVANLMLVSPSNITALVIYWGPYEPLGLFDPIGHCFSYNTNQNSLGFSVPLLLAVIRYISSSLPK